MSLYYEPLTYHVSQEEDGILLKTILQSRMHLSRKLLSRLKLTEQGITVNGERQYISIRVREGDLVEVRMLKEESDDILPQPLPLDILHEDEQLLVLNKAAGMIVHPTHGHYVNTLANGVVHYWQQQGKSYRFRPIHRLDQETSGTLAVAKNPFVHQQVSEQMQAHQVKKEYIALVHGVMEDDQGTVNEPIDRDPDQPHIRIVTPSGYAAVTHYRVERRFREATMVRLWLETGRTHQIRVHMKHLGHPLLGDKLYLLGEPTAAVQTDADTETARSEGSAVSGGLGGAGASAWGLDRHALHACTLGFVHPGTKRWIEFEAPLPDDLTRCVERLEEFG
ncbi:RluA family pseudouridine synthase [Paenibacillus doosanensis]|uniref:RluA family pseudouridine synthase n=1 Tax=Paenibacillus doosanensis TaxID=1229154 RepID=UPI00218011CA|nr:RluA family pseudouridine synthase [Paenibacillus doosanensis]MCS7460814.1 RluA family pseudouridine synthase [Paenibacillus doosanensis]